MKLSEVFTQLTHGEMSQLALGGQVFGETPDEKAAILISHTNLGLTALYKRFNLKEQQLEFELSTSGDVYQLQRDDLLKIEKVMTVEGTELPLNNSIEPYSCFTPQLNQVRVPLDIVNQVASLPDEYKTTALRVVFRANHPKIPDDTFPETYDLELPYSHLEALLYYIASRVNNPLGASGNYHAGDSWAAKYEMECLRLSEKNLQVDEVVGNIRLVSNGWV